MDTNYKPSINKNIFLLIIGLFAMFIVFSLSEYVTAFLGSVLFYILFKSWMETLVTKRRWSKNKAAILVILISFVIILLPITLFFTMAYNKVVPIISNPNLFLPYVNEIDVTLQQKFGIELVTDGNIEALKAASTTIVSGALNIGFSFISSIIMMYFFLYFMLISFNRMEAYIVLTLPFKKEKIKMFSVELMTQTFSNAIGIPLIALVQGLCGYFIYLIAGVPDAGFWAILTGVSSIIPLIGTGIVWVPITLYLFYIGYNWQGITLVFWCLLVMGSMDNVIRFLLAKKMADVHPIVTVLGIILGLEYLGITGLIFGPLIISYFLILTKIYYADYQQVTKKAKTKEAVLEIGVPLIYSKKIMSGAGKQK